MTGHFFCTNKTSPQQGAWAWVNEEERMNATVSIRCYRGNDRWFLSVMYDDATAEEIKRRIDEFVNDLSFAEDNCASPIQPKFGLMYMALYSDHTEYKSRVDGKNVSVKDFSVLVAMKSELSLNDLKRMVALIERAIFDGEYQYSDFDPVEYINSFK